ncbi:unnamed protein product [Mytilus coruscus]|uniref:B box-type domain-containing protein n=1 Tax=Mytilus coruscus TaxID=42192 RepID=A0A6J8BAR9_MYTCO|nr:unnamed protein product [Mytilus coruscus]
MFSDLTETTLYNSHGMFKEEKDFKAFRKRIPNWSAFFRQRPRTYTSTLDEIPQPPSISTSEGITTSNTSTTSRITPHTYSSTLGVITQPTFPSTSEVITTTTNTSPIEGITAPTYTSVPKANTTTTNPSSLGGVSSNQILPLKNTYLNKNSSSTRKFSTSTKISLVRGAQVPISCKVCREDGNVQYKCQNCLIALCYTCCKKHLSKKSYQDHLVINVNDGSTILKPIKCPVKTHRKDDISIFCKKCDKFMCLKCLTESNHQTSSLKELETLYAEDIELLNKYHKIMVEDYKNKFMGELAKIETSKCQHEEFYEKERKKIIQHDKMLKEEITKQTNKLLKELKMELQKTKADLENQSHDIEENICTLVKKISTITKETRNSDLMCVHGVRKEIEKFIPSVKLSNVNLPIKVKEFIKADLHADSVENFFGILQNSDMKIVIKTYSTNLKSISSLSNTNYAICLGSKEDSVIRNVILANGSIETLQEIKDIKSEHLSLSKTGNILVALHNDPCIKVLTESGKMNKFYEFDSTEWFRTPQVPLCIHVLQNGKRMIETKEIDGDLGPLSQTSCRQVVLQSSDGKQLNCYERDKKGNRLFTLPIRITSNSTGKICVIDKTDAGEGRLVTIDSEGVVKWIYNGHPKKSHLKFNPTDIGTTSRDNIVVSDLNNAIHIINYNGQMVSFLQTETLGIMYPLSLDIYCKDELLIGCKHDQAKLHIITFTGF